jgi:hypothetical protein
MAMKRLPGRICAPKVALPALLALLLLLSAALAQPPIRPETGSFIRDSERNGHGLLIIHNNWRMDTVAVLVDSGLKPLCAVYIRSRASFNLTAIEDGAYGLYFTVGTLWNSKDGRFDSLLGYYRYNSPLVFETAETDQEIEYSVFELDLYEAKASNFLPDNFQFPDLRA